MTTLAQSVRAYLGTLTLAGGDLDGRPFVVWPWEARFLRGALAPGVSTAALSVARSNGKTGLVGGIATAVVDPAGRWNRGAAAGSVTGAHRCRLRPLGAPVIAGKCCER